MLVVVLFLQVVLDQGVYDGVYEVRDHRHHEVLPHYCYQWSRFIHHVLCKQCLFLFVDSGCEYLLYCGTDFLERVHYEVDLVLTEAEYDEEGLYGDFVDGFADERGREEHRERDEEVAAQEPGQVEQRVRHGGQDHHRQERMLLQSLVDVDLQTLHQRQPRVSATLHLRLVNHLRELFVFAAG